MCFDIFLTLDIIKNSKEAEMKVINYDFLVWFSFWASVTVLVSAIFWSASVAGLTIEKFLEELGAVLVRF